MQMTQTRKEMAMEQMKEAQNNRRIVMEWVGEARDEAVHNR